MIDRVVDVNITEFPEISEELRYNLQVALSEGMRVLTEAKNDESFAPFTAIVVGDEILFNPYSADDAEDAFAEAIATVKNTENAKSYAFCYDGFIETEEGTKDAVIAEGGLANVEEGHAIAQLYTKSGDADSGTVDYEFMNKCGYLGAAPNFFAEE